MYFGASVVPAGLGIFDRGPGDESPGYCRSTPSGFPARRAGGGGQRGNVILWLFTRGRVGVPGLKFKVQGRGASEGARANEGARGIFRTYGARGSVREAFLQRFRSRQSSR
jgi:hypothetical protein